VAVCVLGEGTLVANLRKENNSRKKRDMKGETIIS
jgi:hypothetical protein